MKAADLKRSMRQAIISFLSVTVLLSGCGNATDSSEDELANLDDSVNAICDQYEASKARYSQQLSDLIGALEAGENVSTQDMAAITADAADLSEQAFEDLAEASVSPAERSVQDAIVLQGRRFVRLQREQSEAFAADQLNRFASFQAALRAQADRVEKAGGEVDVRCLFA